MFEKLCDELSKLPEVTALALGGSRSGQEYDVYRELAEVLGAIGYEC